MAKGYQANSERLSDINAFGKAVSKRADFRCEWCENKEDLRLWDHQPDETPCMESLALLCHKCREWAAGKRADTNELYAIRNALWSNVPAVAEGAAKVMARCRESWVREAIEASCIADTVKAEILK